MVNEVTVEIKLVPPNVLHVEPDEVPVAGFVRGGGIDRPFFGWIDLLNSLEAIAQDLARQHSSEASTDVTRDADHLSEPVEDTPPK